MKWVRWLIGFVVILWLLVGWLVVRVYLPVNPIKPYFLVSVNRISGLEWPLSRFQPVYLARYKKDNGIYLKVMYRDGENKIRLTDVWIAGKTDSQFRLGERLKILYLEETPMDEGKEPIKAEICGRSPVLCQVADYIESVGGLGNIVKNKLVPKGIVIPTLEINRTTDEK